MLCIFYKPWQWSAFNDAQRENQVLDSETASAEEKIFVALFNFPFTILPQTHADALYLFLTCL